METAIHWWEWVLGGLLLAGGVVTIVLTGRRRDR
jgi:hypothetical protein